MQRVHSNEHIDSSSSSISNSMDMNTIFDLDPEMQSFPVAVVLVWYGLVSPPIFGKDIYATELAEIINRLNEEDYHNDFHISL